jgi:hypothetical protein
MRSLSVFKVSNGTILRVPMVMPYVKSRTSKPQTSQLAKKFLEELEPYANRIQAYRFRLYYYMVARLERETVHDYEGTAEVCRRAIRYFEKKPSAPKIGIAVFCHTLVVCLTMTGKFEEGEEVAQKATRLVEEGSLNWFKGQEQHLVLKFYRRDYQGAFDIFKKTTGHKSSALLPAIERESWKVYEGYIQLLIAAGKINLPDKELDF